MDDLIYRDEAIKKATADFGPGYNWDSLRDFTINALKKIPPVEKKAEWVEVENKHRHKCSNCGIWATIDYEYEENLFPFCPYCGFDMRKENLRGQNQH